jgi:hypothetical protein
MSLIASLFVLTALPLVRVLFQRNDIWWTPKEMALGISESQDRVQIFVRDQSLAALLEGGQLQMLESGSAEVLAVGDIRMRFNNWDRVRAARLPMLLVNAAVCGALAAFFLVLVTGRLAFQSEKGGVAPSRMPS